MSSKIREFKINVSDEQIEELNQKLRCSRWPEKETVSDWSQGVPLGYMQEISDYWLNDYDWRVRESFHNQMPQFIADC